MKDKLKEGDNVETLKQDYQRRLNTVLKELENNPQHLCYKQVRLSTKAACYRSFIAELTTIDKTYTKQDVDNAYHKGYDKGYECGYDKAWMWDV